MKKRVVITGIGPVTAMGIGKDAMFRNIMDMKTCISRIPVHYERNYHYKSRFFVPGPVFSLQEHGIPQYCESIMEEISRLSVLCAKLALEDAGFSIKRKDKYFESNCPEDCMTIIGVGMSSLQTAMHSYTAHISQCNDSNKYRYNRMVIPMLMPNSASSWVSILFGLNGLNYTVNASCASGSLAIGEAYKNIMLGRCDTVITGGVEALSEESGSVMRGFDMLSVLTRSKDGMPLPFSRDRSGFLLNQGAGCLLVLEELQKAKERGSRIYAELSGYEYSSDAYHIVQMDPTGKNITAIIKKLIKDIKIDYLNAHGTATVSNDKIEAEIIQDIFGDKKHQPYINSTKGLLGHSIGASGAIEAAVTALSIKESVLHGNLTMNPIENLNLPMTSMEAHIKYGLSASYGFGGHNALLLLKRFDENE